MEFHEECFRICYNFNVALDDPNLIAAYEKALKLERLIFKLARKSEYTRKKADADLSRDRGVRLITNIVHNNMKHLDPTIRDHARHVNNLLDAYGSIPHADYDAETANIDSLITRLQSTPYQAAVTALRLKPWIDELKAQNEHFKSLVDEYATEQLEKPKETPKEARKQTDLVLQAIISRLTSLVVLDGGKGTYQEFVDTLNVLINHYNNLVHEHYGRLHVRTDLSTSEMANIPIQSYTGKPIFVIPELTLTVEREGKVHVLHPMFSEDFTVSYKNNIDPGTATLTVHGIGKFVGEIVTTFTIEAAL
jgi:hypothetical protein